MSSEKRVFGRIGVVSALAIAMAGLALTPAQADSSFKLYGPGRTLESQAKADLPGLRIQCKQNGARANGDGVTHPSNWVAFVICRKTTP